MGLDITERLVKKRNSRDDVNVVVGYSVDTRQTQPLPILDDSGHEGELRIVVTKISYMAVGHVRRKK